MNMQGHHMGGGFQMRPPEEAFSLLNPDMRQLSPNGYDWHEMQMHHADLEPELHAARAQMLLVDLAADADGAGERKGEAPLRALLARLERAAARWPGVVELQARLALAAVRLAEIVEARADGQAEARALRARAASLVEPLEQRGALAFEFRGLPERAHRSH